MGDLAVCISRFDDTLFERYRIRSLLNETSAIYHKSFHPKRCNVLICKHPKGEKYKAAKQKNVAIVNYLWLIDGIKYGQKQDYDQYKLYDYNDTKNEIFNQSKKSQIGHK